jgi:hypothetical protein
VADPEGISIARVPSHIGLLARSVMGRNANESLPFTGAHSSCPMENECYRTRWKPVRAVQRPDGCGGVIISWWSPLQMSNEKGMSHL